MRESGGTETDKVIEACVHFDQRRHRGRGRRPEFVQDLDRAFLEQLVQRAIGHSSRDERRQIRLPRFEPCPESAPRSVHYACQGRHGSRADFSQGVPVDGYYEIKVKAEAKHRKNPYDPGLFARDTEAPFRLGALELKCSAIAFRRLLPLGKLP